VKISNLQPGAVPNTLLSIGSGRERPMNRRGLLQNITAFGTSYTLGSFFPKKAFSQVPLLAAIIPTVWDLKSGESLPSVRPRPHNVIELNDDVLKKDDLEKEFRSIRSLSLFLVSNPVWLQPRNDTQIEMLYNAYEGYARALGMDHAAVFFWTRPPQKSGTKLAGTDLAINIDVNACTAYSKLLNLDISYSPHIVVTTEMPVLNGQWSGRCVKIGLNGLSPESMEQLISYVAARVVNEHLDQKIVDSERYWLTWKDVLSSAYKDLEPLLKSTKISIDAGPVKLELGAN
jgi:hypothetical protein